MEPNAEDRGLLDAYAGATSPTHQEVERALTRTLARVETTERTVRRLPDPRARFVAIAAASVATLVITTAAIAGVRWVRAQPDPEPGPSSAARWDHSNGGEPTEPVFVSTPTRPDLIREQPPQRLAEPEPLEQPASNSVSDSPRGRARTKPIAAPPPDPGSIDENQLAEESRLLARVRRALHESDYIVALEWADEHARRHPDGALTEERMVLEAVAACRGDQRARGEATAKQLRQRFPSSPALAKVEQACAGE